MSRDAGVAARFADFTSSASDFFLYPLPDVLNCQGTVTALEFCYVIRNFVFGTSTNILTFYTLEQAGSAFTITNIIDVSSVPTAQICTEVSSISRTYCCDTMQLSSNDQFTLPAADFAFGFDVKTDINTVDLLAYRSASTLRESHFFFDPAANSVPQTLCRSLLVAASPPQEIHQQIEHSDCSTWSFVS